MVSSLAMSAPGCGNLIGLTVYVDGVCAGGVEKQSCYTGPPGTKGKGKCKGGTRTCLADNSGYETTCEGEVLPDAQDDCSGRLCKLGEQQSCYSGPAGTQDVGICAHGAKTCLPDGTGFGACLGAVLPDPTNQNGGTCDNKEWAEIFGSSSDLSAILLAVDKDENVILAGTFFAPLQIAGTVLVPAGMSDDFVAKFDASGKALWAKRFGDASDNGGFSTVTTDADGNIILGGNLQGSADFGGGALTSAGSADVLVVKLGPAGDLKWAKTFGDAAQQLFNSAAVDSHNDVIIGGSFFGTISFGSTSISSSQGQAAFLGKVSGQDGSGVWLKQFARDPNDPQTVAAVRILSVALDSSDDITVAGNFDTSANFGDPVSFPNGGVVLAKYDSTGEYSWSVPVRDAYSMSLMPTVVGASYWTVSLSDMTNFGADTLSPGTYVLKISSIGTYVSSVQIADGATKNGISPLEVFVEPIGDILLTGGFNSLWGGGPLDLGGGPLPDAGGFDAFVGKLDPTGKYLWGKTFGDTADQSVRAVAVDPVSQAVVIAGITLGSMTIGVTTLKPGSGGGSAMFLAKLPATGP